MADRSDALVQLIALLAASGYAFVTPTPATHARVLARHGSGSAASLTDIFGWNLPFAAETLPPPMFQCLDAAGKLVPEGPGHWRSTIRVSSLRGRLYCHSAYPTEDVDAVFFGPDSYRFAELIAAEFERSPPPVGAAIVDIGTGSGVGAIVAADLGAAPDLTMTDINPAALSLAGVNARAAGVPARFLQCRGTEAMAGTVDVALANPPYIIDDLGRAYRHGGDLHGGAVSLEIARDAVARLSPGGRLILYTGSAIVGGVDGLRAALAAVADETGCLLSYREIDPDVFGEELERPAYADVDRIAVVAAIVSRPVLTG